MIMTVRSVPISRAIDAVDLLHRRRAADQRQLVLGSSSSGMRPATLVRRAQRPLDDADQLAQVERLRQVFERAPLGRLDRGQQRVLRAHDDDAQLRADLLDARDQVEAVLVRHDHVGDDEVALAVRDPAPQGRGIAGHPHIVPEPDQRLVQHHADRAIVVGHQDRRRHHPLPSCTPRRIRTAEWQKHPEHGAPGLAVEFDDAAVVADHLGDQCKTEASAVPLRRDERIEQMRRRSSGMPPPLSVDRHHQRQVLPALAARHARGAARADKRSTA